MYSEKKGKNKKIKNMKLYTVSPNKRQLPFAVLLILKGTFLIKQPQYPALPYPQLPHQSISFPSPCVSVSPCLSISCSENFLDFHFVLTHFKEITVE